MVVSADPDRNGKAVEPSGKPSSRMTIGAGIEASYNANMQTSRKDTAGTVRLDDAKGLAPRLSALLRSASERIEGSPGRGRTSRRSFGTWPSTRLRIEAGVPDVAGSRERTIVTIMRGVSMTPSLRIVDGTDDEDGIGSSGPAPYLRSIADLVEGGRTGTDRDVPDPAGSGSCMTRVTIVRDQTGVPVIGIDPSSFPSSGHAGSEGDHGGNESWRS